MVIWLIGLSGAGKTTIGEQVVRLWRQTAPNCVLVDGDAMRKLFGSDATPADFSMAARRLNAVRITEVCAWLDRQDIHVVCCILSLFPDLRAENRSRFGRYFEVFIDAPLDLVEQRDPKGLYRAARAGQKNVAGIDIPFPRPERPDLVIDATRNAPPEQVAREILLRAGAIKPT